MPVGGAHPLTEVPIFVSGNSGASAANQEPVPVPPASSDSKENTGPSSLGKRPATAPDDTEPQPKKAAVAGAVEGAAPAQASAAGDDLAMTTALLPAGAPANGSMWNFLSWAVALPTREEIKRAMVHALVMMGTAMRQLRAAQDVQAALEEELQMQRQQLLAYNPLHNLCLIVKDASTGIGEQYVAIMEMFRKFYTKDGQSHLDPMVMPMLQRAKDEELAHLDFFAVGQGDFPGVVGYLQVSPELGELTEYLGIGPEHSRILLVESVGGRHLLELLKREPQRKEDLRRVRCHIGQAVHDAFAPCTTERLSYSFVQTDPLTGQPLAGARVYIGPGTSAGFQWVVVIFKVRTPRISFPDSVG